MLANDVFQVFAQPFTFNGVVFRQADFFDNGFHQFLGHDIAFTVKVQELIFKFWVQADGFVGWQGPRGGGPNDEVSVVFSEFALGIGDLEADIDGWGFFFAVFDFSFSQRGVTVRAPVNRLGAFVDVALLGHFAEDADFAGFKFWL